MSKIMNAPVVFEANGQEVKLTGTTVANYLTRGNGQVSEQEIVMFMNLCKFQKLNPFLNEAYLIKFGSQQAQIVVSKEAFMKRAESHPQYGGMKAGIIVERDNELVEIEGAVKLKADQLIGGWATVFRKDREQPTVVKISLEEFGKNQATWKDMPQNMIRKSAIVNALREAFPEHVGAMYSEDEVQTEPRDIAAEVNDDIDRNANQEIIDFDEGPIKAENWNTERKDDQNENYARQLNEVEIEELRKGKPDPAPEINAEPETADEEQGALFENLSDLDPGF